MSAVVIPVADRVKVKKVLVATDFSCASSHLAEIAAAVGKHFNCTLQFVHVRPDASGIPDASMAMKSAKTIQEEARSRMAELLRQPDLEGLQIHGRLLVGDPAARILDLAREERPDLMIVGTHGSRGIKHFLLGSVAEEIFRHAPCPVLTIGPKIHPRFARARDVKTILVPVDMSAESRQAVPLSASVAAEFHACTRFVHVLPSGALENAELKEVVEHLAQQLRLEIDWDVSPRCQPEILIESGDEASAIVAAAHECKADLIVMGLHRHTTSMGLRSSITYRTILGSDCPVLTIRLH